MKRSSFLIALSAFAFSPFFAEAEGDGNDLQRKRAELEQEYFAKLDIPENIVENLLDLAVLQRVSKASGSPLLSPHGEEIFQATGKMTVKSLRLDEKIVAEIENLTAEDFNNAEKMEELRDKFEYQERLLDTISMNWSLLRNEMTDCQWSKWEQQVDRDEEAAKRNENK